MAQKGGYGAPPPYQGAPPQYGASNTTVYVNQPPPKVVHTSSPGLFGTVMKDLNSFGREVEKGINWAGNQIDQSLKECQTGAVLQVFQTGNVVQLVSKASFKSLQIVMSPTQQLVVDGNGGEGPQAFNAVWTVVNEGKNKVRLHNNNNYLAIVNGTSQIIHMPPGSMHGEETKIQLDQRGQFVTLQSCKSLAHHLGILENGQLKPASVTTGTDKHAMFGVRLISTPYVGGPVKH